MTREIRCPFCQKPMETGQVWIAGKGEWKNHLRLDWASLDKELQNKFFTRSKKAEKTVFSAERQGMSSPAVEAVHCSSCDTLVATLSRQTSKD